jgi:hypothetical protein
VPATSSRTTPTRRMIDLLSEEKRSLMRTGWPARHDDQELYHEAVQVDVSRARILLVLIDLRDEHAEKTQIAAAQREKVALEETFAGLLGGLPGMAAFEAAWERSWETMVLERAWPHPTQERRSWRRVMLETKPETRACWLGLPTPYQRFATALRGRDASPDGVFGVQGSLLG